MFSLIITIVSIVLVLVLAIVAIYYGGGAFKSGSIKVVAQTLSSQSLQISAARALARAQNRELPTGANVAIPTDLLRVMPVPPKAAYHEGEPSSNDWVYYLPGASGHFGIALKINEEACMEVNRSQGFVGIPAAWDGRTSIQCFGPTDSGYTYLFEPTGTTTEEHDAAVEKSVEDARVTIPTAEPGYPRKCPNNTTITTGVCEGGVPVEPVATGYWVITAWADNYYDTTLESMGFSPTCPAGAIDPTGPDAITPPSLPGDTFNADGIVTMQWGDSMDAPQAEIITRTWCIPAAESDVTVTGLIPVEFAQGEVGNTTLATTAPNVTQEYWVWSNNSIFTLTAKGVQWSLLASTFEVDHYSRDLAAYAFMFGQKLAIGQGPRPTHTYFVNSPVFDNFGYQYQLLQGTIQFEPVLPPCAPMAPVALGVGGGIVRIEKSSNITTILKQDGSAWGTGDAYYDDFGLCVYEEFHTWRIFATDVKSLSIFGRGIYLVKNDGSLWMSGEISNGSGGPAHFREYEFDRFTQVLGAGVAHADGGNNGAPFMAHLRTDGTVWFVGSNSQGVAGIGTYRERFRDFYQIQSGVVRLKASVSNIYTQRSDGSLWATGSTENYRMGIPPARLDTGSIYYTTPGRLPYKLGDNVLDFTWSSTATVMVRTDGTVYAAGANTCTQFGRTGTNLQTFTRIASELGPIVRAWSVTDRISLLDANGDLWEAGCNVSVFGANPVTRATFTKILSGVRLYSPGKVNHFVDTSGGMWARGLGGEPGVYGNGSTAESNAWVPVPY